MISAYVEKWTAAFAMFWVALKNNMYAMMKKINNCFIKMLQSDIMDPKYIYITYIIGKLVLIK